MTSLLTTERCRATNTNRACTLAFGALLLSACTTGRLEYLTPEGERKYACATEYTWQPSVDKYAVEYVLAYCAKQAREQGNTVVDTRLLALDLSLPRPPDGQQWTHALAKQQHQSGQLTDQQYGYIIAHLDLGLDSD